MVSASIYHSPGSGPHTDTQTAYDDLTQAVEDTIAELRIRLTTHRRRLIQYRGDDVFSREAGHTAGQMDEAGYILELLNQIERGR